MTSPGPSTPRSRERRSRRELVAAALLVAFFTVVFLWEPIVRTDAALVPAQIGQRSTWTHVKPAEGEAQGQDAAADLVGDAWSRYVPWNLFSRAAIRDGRLPLWNDLSGAGAPHFSNPDAAVLSPFTWPWYVLDVRTAALVAALLRLFALGWFTYLFLAELRLAFAAAVAGAVAFQFAGVNVVGLLAPASAAAVLAPAGLFLVERIARAAERAIAEPSSATPVNEPARARSEIARHGWGPAAALAVVVAGTFFSGGFATFSFALLLVIAYACARLWRIGARAPGSAARWRAMRRASIRVAAGFAVGACMASIQLLPWIADASQVARGSTTAAMREPLPVDALALDVFPDLLGSPSGAFQLEAGARPDRRVVLAEYVGSLALFLALLGACFARRRRAAAFFALTALVWFAAAHGLLGRTIFAAWPGGSAAPLGQGQVVFAFSIAVLAAFALDRVAAWRRAADARIAFALVVLGTCGVWALRASADAFASGPLALVPEAQRVFAQMSSTAHVEALSAIFCVGLLCVALALAVGPGRARSVLVLGAGAAMFAQTGGIMGDVVPLAPRSIVYPRTDELKRLTELARGNQVLVLGADRIEPDAHLAHGLRQLCAAEPERTSRADRLLRAQFGVADDVIVRADERALRLFGVGLVLEKNRSADVPPGAGAAQSPGLSFASAEILPASPFVQRFVDLRGNGEPLGFEWITNGWRNESTFRVTVDDAVTGERLAATTYPPGELRPRGQTRLPCNIDFAGTQRRAGRKLVLTIAADDAVAGRSWSVLCRGASHVGTPENAQDPADWSATQGQAAVSGRLALQPDDDPTSLAFVEQIGAFAVRACADAPRFRTVSRAYAANDAEVAWAAVMRAGFDPRTLVVLEGVDAATADPHADPDTSASTAVIDERAGHVRLRVQRARPGWLVADIAWCPGWRASVDGAPVPVHCANYAFTALALPAGEHTVELDFAPASVRIGSVISIVGLVILSGMMVASFARARPGHRTA